MPLALASPLAARPLSAPLRPRRDGLRPRRVARSRPARDASIVASSSSDAPAPVVVGVGSAGVDYLASVASFPEPDAKLRTDALEIQGGGNCGNALTAVARLGCAPRILTKLSDDAAGRAIVAEFEADGVDTAAIVVEPGKSSPFTYIIVDREGATRTCIHTPGPEFAPEEITPAEIDALLDGASLCYFDGRLTEVALEVAAAARAKNIPVLVEGERPRQNLEALLELGDYVCTSENFPADASTRGAEDAAATCELLARLPRARAIVTTLGAAGAVMIRRVTPWGEDDVERILGELDAEKREAEAPADEDVARLREEMAAYEDDIAFFESEYSESESESSDDSIPRVPLEDVLSDLMEDAMAYAEAHEEKYGKDSSVPPLPLRVMESVPVYLTADGAASEARIGPVEVFYARAARLEDDLVADTTGAGDAFIGSICHGIATGMELGDAMRLGAYVAAKKCLKLGARPGLPKRDDVPSQLFEPYPDETP